VPHSVALTRRGDDLERTAQRRQSGQRPATEERDLVYLNGNLEEEPKVNGVSMCNADLRRTRNMNCYSRAGFAAPAGLALAIRRPVDRKVPPTC
jgi:hypothetical protein